MNYYGPVPVSRVYQEADEIQAQVKAGNNVLLSHQGVVIGQVTAYEDIDMLTLMELAVLDASIQFYCVENVGATEDDIGAYTKVRREELLARRATSCSKNHDTECCHIHYSHSMPHVGCPLR